MNCFSSYDCSLIDGIRINFDKGWALIRSSNTQPVIVCRFESSSKEELERIKNDILNKINQFGI